MVYHKIQEILIEDYNYFLPEDKIARYPLVKRDESKLLYYNKQTIESLQFKHLPDLLNDNDILIFNNARVIQARMDFIKDSGAHIEIFCLEPYEPSDYNLAFQVQEKTVWKCLVGNLKKWKSGKLMKEIIHRDHLVRIEAQKLGKIENAELIEFKWDMPNEKDKDGIFTFGDILEAIGNTPLPPYLNREAELEDKTRYQTVYAKIIGSVAAPTAGLHFTDEVIQSLIKRDIHKEFITLHVSAGTFRPVKSKIVTGHEMHKEHFQVSIETVKKIALHEGRIIAVGTTSARTLESLYQIGLKILNNSENTLFVDQWEAYRNPVYIDKKTVFLSLWEYMKQNNLNNLSAATSIMIIPGYQFNTIEGLITNFHQPQSTLLLLIAAAVGAKWKEIYDFALTNGYRFLSYGDCSLLIFK